MDRVIKVLILEDVSAHAELIRREVRKSYPDVLWRHAADEAAFREYLHEQHPDIILADYSLPGFDGLAALEVVKTETPDIPFVFVSGAIGEDLAIESLKKGATDYVLKHRLERLAPAIDRALREASERRARQTAEQALRKAYDEMEQKVRQRTAELHESQQRFEGIFASAMDAIITIDANKTIRLFNEAAGKAFRCDPDAAIGKPFDPFLSKPLAKMLGSLMTELESGDTSRKYIYNPDGLNAVRSTGEEFPLEATISRTDAGREPLYTLILRDIADRMQEEQQIRQLQLEKTYLESEVKAAENQNDMIGVSQPMKEVYINIEKVAGTDSTVLINGETGTGKELVARAIHQASTRSDKVLIKVNCAALPANLIESELFGHEKGAFTGAIARKIGRFEMADGGTIFLDEIGEIPIDLQAKLLRVLQEGEVERLGGQATRQVDVRVIAATNRNLSEEVAANNFRADLFYRLNVFPLSLPSLRERSGDVPLLAAYFMQKYAARMKKALTAISQAALFALKSYHWPGNVRELENVIERAVILSDRDELELGSWFQPPNRQIATNGFQTLETVERDYIERILEETNWKVSGEGGAAAILGMHRSTLESRMKKLGISRSK